MGGADRWVEPVEWVGQALQTPDCPLQSALGVPWGPAPCGSPRGDAVGVGLVSSCFWEAALTSCSSPQNLEALLHFPGSQSGCVPSSPEKEGLRETSVRKRAYVAISLTT